MKYNSWLNLPVQDVQRSKDFFEKIGAVFVENETDSMFGVYLGSKKMQVMMFGHEEFERFTQAEVSDTSKTAEFLISMEATNKEEVDDLSEKVRAAGGIIFAGPETWDGWMYGMGFQDPDGHRWNIAYMDWAKMPK